MRRGANLSQQEFARLLGVPVNTFRMWDSGLRPAPVPIVKRALEALDAFARRHELLPLEQLAKELGVHVRTLQAAARTGRLEAHFSVQSVFGRPIRSASRAAGDQFMAKHYRCFSGQAVCPLPLPIVPADYDAHVRALRRRMRLKTPWLDALAQPGRPWCISGNPGSERRHRCCGRVSRR